MPHGWCSKSLVALVALVELARSWSSCGPNRRADGPVRSTSLRRSTCWRPWSCCGPGRFDVLVVLVEPRGPGRSTSRWFLGGRAGRPAGGGRRAGGRAAGRAGRRAGGSWRCGAGRRAGAARRAGGPGRAAACRQAGGRGRTGRWPLNEPAVPGGPGRPTSRCRSTSWRPSTSREPGRSTSWRSWSCCGPGRPTARPWVGGRLAVAFATDTYPRPR